MSKALKKGVTADRSCCASPIAFNAFHNIQVFEGTTVSDIVDGTTEGSVTGGTTPISLNDLYIGTRSYTSGFTQTADHDLQGQLASVLVYSGTLSATDLAQTEDYLSTFFAPAVTPSSLSTTITKTKVPTTAVGGVKFTGSITTSVDNTAATTTRQTIHEAVYASTDGYIDSSSVLLEYVKHAVNLKTGKSTTITVPFKNVTLPADSYTLLAQTTDSGNLTSVSSTGPAIAVAVPVITVTSTASTVHPSVFSTRAVNFTTVVTVTNTGNIPTTGDMVIIAEPFSANDPVGTLATTQSTFSAKGINPGKSKKFTIRGRYLPGSLVDGTYNDQFTHRAGRRNRNPPSRRCIQ